MKENKWKKFARYYKPYLGSFAADMFFAILGAAVTLIIPDGSALYHGHSYL